MRAYDKDLRERVLVAMERGDSPAEAAKRFEICKRSAERWLRRWRENNERHSRRIGGHRRARVAGQEATLRDWIAHEPGLTLAQMCERLQQQQDLKISSSALSKFLNQIGLRYKKNAQGERTRSP